MTHRDQNDETLVMLTLAGEQSAYERLVLRYQSAVILAASDVTHSRFMSEDAAQDAFVTAWMKLGTLAEPEKFGAWVCRIARNCAVNMVTRYRDFLSLDAAESYAFPEQITPAELYVQNEEAEELRASVMKLPKRVKEIIYLHYFEGLSVVEIADRLQLAEGTVKSGLFDGRKRLRKELCAMNERENDTLVMRVMKKVEELKLWQMKNDKDGFEAVYRDVLSEVENLPESKNKYHALADTLFCGWWWVEGEQNDALFARIKDAALKGKNEDVMEFVASREELKIPWDKYKDKITIIRDKVIPELTEYGFRKALAREWFYLGYCYSCDGQPELAKEANEKALSLLTPSDLYYGMAKRVTAHEEFNAAHKEQSINTFHNNFGSAELRLIDGKLRYFKDAYMNKGELYSFFKPYHLPPITFAALCDGLFFDESLAVGGFIEGSDGTTLTFEDDNATVETPCGTFEGCKVFATRYYNWEGKSLHRVYYKDGVGIVKYSRTYCDICEVYLLTDYHIAGGTGLLPLAVGNRWDYKAQYAEKFLHSECTVDVLYADGERFFLSGACTAERFGYDENSWLDMVQKIRSEYCITEGNIQHIHDVSDAAERAEALAVTPMEKAHTKAAVSVIRRIMETDDEFNPSYTAFGVWNFFNRYQIRKHKGTYTEKDCRRFSFEWKDFIDGCEPLLCNDIYGILQDATKCLWSDEWYVGMDTMVEYNLFGQALKTSITCTEAEPITTKAGTFENCICLSLDIRGVGLNRTYRGGKKRYYFASGIGIVRVVNENLNGIKEAVYELSAYKSTGEGYMPFVDGLYRKYEAVGLTDGFYGAAEYTYVADEDGDIVIFADKTGIRNIPAPITRYSYIEDEILEEKLRDEGKYWMSRDRWDINNLKIMTHFLCRLNRNRGKPFKAAAWGRHRIKMLESLGENGEVPPAFGGYYAELHFLMGCYLFGCSGAGADCKEEAYGYLEKAFALYKEWAKIPNGTSLSVGDPLVYGEVKLVKGEGYLLSQAGEKESFPYAESLKGNASLMYYGMTAPRGWEWFNSVRNENRFKEYIERAKALMEE